MKAPAAVFFWRKVDSPGHDSCRFFKLADECRLLGTAVFLKSGRVCQLRYDVVARPVRRARMKTFLIILGIGILLMHAYGRTATPSSACPIQGEVIHWVADYCMFKFETDDEIAVSDCIADQIKIGIKNECTEKANYKRALCELTIKSGATRGTVGQCVADRSFMGNTVRNGGVGARR